VGSFPTAARLSGVGIVPPALNRAEPSGSLADYVIGRQTVGLSRPEAPIDRDGGSRRPAPGAQPSLQSSTRPIETASGFRAQAATCQGTSHSRRAAAETHPAGQCRGGRGDEA
jgi:hypothetical protein